MSVVIGFACVGPLQSTHFCNATTGQSPAGDIRAVRKRSPSAGVTSRRRTLRGANSTATPLGVRAEAIVWRHFLYHYGTPLAPLGRASRRNAKRSLLVSSAC